MNQNPNLPRSQSDFIYKIEILNWWIPSLALIYLIVSMFSIRWILKQSVMNAFQKTIHIVLVLLLPLFWIYLIRMIYQPIPGYKKGRWFDSGTNGDSGGFPGDTGGD